MRRQAGGRRIAAMLFTDIVSSTPLAEEVGDHRWQVLLARHHEEVRGCLRRTGGLEVDTAGDGFFGVFDDPDAATRCAADAVERIHALGLEIRAAVHVGAVGSGGVKPVGVSVHVAARILSLAGPSEILVSEVAVALLQGSAVLLADAGTHRLKGVSKPVSLSRVVAIDGSPLAGPLDPARAAALRSASTVLSAQQSGDGPAAQSAGTAVSAVSRTLLGRGPELDAVDRFVDAGLKSPAALLLEGEPGIGKTSLWREALARAEERGFRLLTCRPSEAEARLAFAALSDLFDEVADRELEDLPEVQRSALAVALLREPAGAAVDPRTVAAAVLGVVRTMSSVSPILIGVDDEQWLDPPTAEMLGFAIRRLSVEHVAVATTCRVRQGAHDPMGLRQPIPELSLERVRVSALERDELGRLLRERIPIDLSASALARVHEVSHGNPFFALELGRALRDSGSDVSGYGPLPIPEDLRDLLRAHLGGLSRTTFETLLLASALSRPTITLLDGASARPTSAQDELVNAARAGLVEVSGDEVRFMHPLFPSAIYAEASAHARRDAHRRLAEAVSNLEERARHLALAVDGHDEDAAAMLEEAAARAEERGAPAAAAELSELSADLTPEERPGDFRRRRIATADRRYHSGDMRTAVGILDEVLASCHPGPDRATVLVDLGRLHWEDDLREATRLLNAALQEENLDDALLFKAHIELANCQANLGEFADAEPHARAAAEIAERSGDPQLVGRSQMELADLRALRGYGVQRELLERAEALIGPRLGILAVQLCVGDDLEEARDRFLDLIQDAAQRGDEADSAFLHFWLSVLELRAGDWDLALRHAAASYSEAGGIGGPPWVSTLVRIHRGDPAARSDAVGALDEAERNGGIIDRLDRRMVLGAAELVGGSPAESHRYLDEAWELLLETGVGDPGLALFVPYGVEALVQLGRPEAAEPLVAWLEERGRSLDRPRALATGARCRGLLLAAGGDRTRALASLEEAVRHHERLPDPFELARTLVVRGSIRRRSRQKRLARESLEAALAIFEQLGAVPWAKRARAELAAISGRPAASGALTPTEERVARLAAAGRTNREIAETLFLSVRTVETHLSHAYHKLGVRSRTELATVVPHLDA